MSGVRFVSDNVSDNRQGIHNDLIFDIQQIDIRH